VQIRSATYEDGKALRALDLATWSSLSSPAPAPSEDGDFFERDLEPRDVLVAVVDTQIAGYVQLGSRSRLESNEHVLEINGLTVDPSHRGRGLGARLVEAAAEEAKSRGARRLTLRVLAPNEHARRIYEACGFQTEGVLRQEFFLDGRYVDDVLMARDLT
jgi:ribosomal protein S18 acetylase RimI-like enzyme